VKQRDRGKNAGHGRPAGEPADTSGAAERRPKLDALRDEIELLEEELRRRERSRSREYAVLQARLEALAEHVSFEAARSEALLAKAATRRQEATSMRVELQRRGRELAAFEQDAARWALTERTYTSRVNELQEQLSELQEQLSEFDQLVSALTADLQQVRGDVERISSSHAWRVGHKLVRSVDRIRMRRRVTQGAVISALGRLERLEQALAEFERARAARGARLNDVEPGDPAVAAGTPPTAPEQLTAAAREALAARIRSTVGPPPQASRWPRVSVVVLNRNGLEHMRRLIAGLTAATDYPSFELVVVDNGSNDGSREYLTGLSPPFSVTLIENKKNVSFSAGNNQGAARADGELLLFLNNDIEPFEGGWLRELVAACVRGGVGAAGATLLHADKLAEGVPLVQHRGIRFRFKLGRLRSYNVDDGGALFGECFGVDAEFPGVTGACLMLRKDLFDQLKGFPDDYRYGTEDVDLGLQIVATGRAIVCSGRAHLLHRESSTQDAQGREFKRINRQGNQQLFAERWGAAVRREYRLGRVRGESFWADGRGAHIGITLSSNDPADGWGDWYTGHELGDALEQLGWRVTYLERKQDSWYVLPEGIEYVLALLDAFDARNVPGDVLTIAWVRSWTERWLEREWFSRFDLVLASSRRSAELISEHAGYTTVTFPLATNLARFDRVAVDPELASDIVFTGNHWTRPRAIQGLTARDGEMLRVFGSGWEDVPELAPYTSGPLPYGLLPAAYSSAKVVVDDTAEHTLPYGAVNSRVFDALACGTVVLSNCEAGVQELFDEQFPTWSDATSLRAKLDELLVEDGNRERLVSRYQAIVRERHTYGHRARQLAGALEQAEWRLSFCIKTAANNRSVAPEWGDTHYGEAVARELRRRGHRATLQVLDEWDDAPGFEYDVVLVLKGLSEYTPRPGQFNVLWNISHPEKVTVRECESYDLVCVASGRFAAELSERVKTPVYALEQATDPRVFYPEPDDRYQRELVFVANSRKVMRRMMSDLLPTERDLVVYGTNWRGLIDDRYIGGHMPFVESRKVFSSASIVLNDHWDGMREHGFVSNRIYDALACGACVLSDELPELHDRFAGAVATYTDRAELHKLVERLLNSPEERAQRGRQGRELVLAEHTFAQRVDQLLEMLARHGCEPRRITAAREQPDVVPEQEHGNGKPARAWSWRALTRSDRDRRAPTALGRRRR
jgi:O-antigen biosynthesis protein